jgi:ABC-type polysaccharide/polyol phosphate transport system ATPase subunit
MSSTAACNSSIPLIEAKNLRLTFRAPTYRSWTFRDLAVNFTKRPLENLRGKRELLQVLQGLSFKVHRGDRIAVLGRNGAGKTSLCRCLSGIYHQTSGELIVRGEVRAVFDTAIGIQPELTGMENLELLSRFIFPSERTSRRELVAEVADFSGLGDFLHAPFKTYSSGMKARLGLSMVTARPADILILDEVFDGADAAFRAKLTGRMNELVRRSGAVIFVSHAPDQVRSMCNKALVIENGVAAHFGDVQKAIAIYEAQEDLQRRIKTPASDNRFLGTT